MTAQVHQAPSFADLDVTLAPHLPPSLDAPTLDLGCGTGRVMAYLIAKGHRNVQGVDVDELAVRWTSEHVSPRVQHISDLGGFLATARARFELIIAKDVIYYFPRPLLLPYLRAIRTALTPGGRMVCEVFNGASFSGPLVKHKDFRIEWIFTEHSLRDALEESGFVVESLVGSRHPGVGFNAALFRGAQRAWQLALSGAYFVERGFDAENPKILSKKLIAVAGPNGVSHG